MSNRLISISPKIAQLQNLEYINVSGNVLKDIPSEIGLLHNLESLFLSNNYLTALPDTLGQLTNLTTLNLSANKLTTLPITLGNLTNLTEINLDGNETTLQFPAPEIVEQGTESILTYLRAVQPGSERQWVSKLLVVGEGGVGKSSLLRALRGEAFDLALDSTHGIQIDAYTLQHPSKPDVSMQLNTWDFGGQEIYHATHQFFLTNRSLFLVAWNARHGFEQGKLYYWLDTIKALAPDSPILLVATWTDERDADIPLSELRRTYPQIVGQCAISNKTGMGIDGLRTKIAELAASLPLMGETWPTTWLNAANAVRSRVEKHTTVYQLRTQLAEHGVQGGNADVLMRWLHELGDILYFPDNAELADTVMLKPQWVTEYISKVLVSEEVIERYGVFTRKHMAQLWADLDIGMRELFLRLMERFDLSYRILDDRDMSLVVERLPYEPPPYQERWNAIKADAVCNEITMRFRLDIIPAGVPTWFIARTHRFTTNTHWRTGALFGDNHEQPQHLGLARAFLNEKYLELAVRGPVPQNFFALLRDGIEQTLNRFPGLTVRRMIPCPGHDGEPCDHEFSYEDLVKRINKKPTIECPRSMEDVSVTDLLFGIDWNTQYAVIAVVKEAKQEIVAEVRAASEQELTKISELSTLAQREFAAIFAREQRLPESHAPAVFVLRPNDKQGWRGVLQRVANPFTGKFIQLQLCCQEPGDWHPALDGGVYEIDQPAEWFVAVAPLLHLITEYVVPLAVPTAAWLAPFGGAASGNALTQFSDFYKVDIEFTKALLEKLPELKRDSSTELAKRSERGDDMAQAQGAALRALRKLLDEKDPSQHWGGLRKILTPEGHYLWLCEHHAAQYLH